MSSRTALLLVTNPADGAFHNDNHEHLHRAFTDAGWQVHSAPHASLVLRAGQPFAGELALNELDLIWPVGFGPREGYSDRMEVLDAVDSQAMVTPARTQMHLHSKAEWLEFAPETHLTRDPAQVTDIVAAGGRWVLKPIAGSFGRDVTLINDPSGLITADLDRLARSHEDWLLQRYVEEIIQGEFRTLIAGRRIIGTYRRIPEDGFHANLALQGKACADDLPDTDQTIVAATHRRLIQAGVGFAAIDTCGGYVLEVNVANPGGLATLDALYGGDAAARAVAALTARLSSM